MNKKDLEKLGAIVSEFEKAVVQHIKRADGLLAHASKQAREWREEAHSLQHAHVKLGRFKYEVAACAADIATALVATYINRNLWDIVKRIGK